MIEKILIHIGTVIAVLGAIGVIAAIHIQAYDNLQMFDFLFFISFFDCVLGILLVCVGKARR